MADCTVPGRATALVVAAASLLGACTGVPPAISPCDVHGRPRQDPVTSIASVTHGTAAERGDELSRTLEAAVDASGAPGAQAAVVFPDLSTWTAGAGLSTQTEPLRADHLMAIGSITKLHTGALVLDLADAGRLSIDDELDRKSVV